MIPVIGIDIGQKREPTAIAVAEIDYRPPADPARHREPDESHYFVRHLERLDLGTPYPEIAGRLGEICQGVAGRGRREPVVFADATGLGDPVIDLLRDRAPHADRIWSVHFNHGDRRLEDRDLSLVTLGKAYLVSRLQTLLQGGRLHLPRTDEADRLARELLDFEIRVTEDANERYGAFRVGSQDDLVTALGLATQKEPSVSVYPGRVSYAL